MFPVEASRELQIRIFHRLGTDQFVLTLQLQSGDDVQTRVLEAFQLGRLPTCLYRPTLEYATLAVRESLSDHESRQPLSTSSGHASRSVVGIAAALGEGLLDLEERQWPKLLQVDAGPPVPCRDVTFLCAYDFLLRHRPAFFRTIGTLEDSYLKELRERQTGRQEAISELRRIQSMEMEKKRLQAEGADDGEADDSVFRDVQFLVAQQMSEIEAIERHWLTEIDQLKVRQKESYCDLIVDFFEQEMEQIQEVEGSASADVTTGGCEDGGSPHRRFVPEPNGFDNLACPFLPSQSGDESIGDHSAKAGPDKSLPSATRESKLLECAEVRAVFGQRHTFFILRLWVGDIMDMLVPCTDVLESNQDWAADDDDGAGPQVPQELLGVSSYAHHYFARGSGLPVHQIGWPQIRSAALASSSSTRGGIGTSVLGSGTTGSQGLKGQGVFRSPSLRFWEPPVLPSPVRLSPNAYSDRLRGLLIPTPENLKFEASQAVMLGKFKNFSDQVTDLHFPPLAAQLQRVKAATADESLRSGDYVCTRHSNLGGLVQVAFHLLTGSSEAPASDEVPAAIHRALKRIVCDCHRCHVAELSLPLLLLDVGTSESSLPYAVAQRRAENALRALKGALTRLSEELAPSEVPGLQTLNLVLPLSCAQSNKAGIPTVAETTLTFLRHSFQCV